MTAPRSYPAHARALLGLGLPLIGGHLGQFAIQLTDTIMMGWYDVEALAAIVLGSTMFFVFFIMGSGFGLAVMPMVAAASENGEGEVQIRRVTRMGLWLSAAFSAVTLPPLLWAEPILRAMGQTPDVARLAGQYLAIAGWGLLPGLGVMVLKSYLAALERTQMVLWIAVVAALVNAAVNYVLIFGSFGAPELGVRGAAIASVSVQVVSLIGLVAYAVRVFPEHQLFVRLWRMDRGALSQVFRLGWPIGLTNLSEVGLFAASAVMVGWLGAVPLAAHGIAMEMATATFLIHLGLSNAATIRTGKALGRGDIPDLRRGAQVTVALTVAIASVAVAVFLTWPEAMLSLFIDPDDPQKPDIIAIGTGLMMLAALFQMADGGQVAAHGLLRGLQDTRVPMVISGVTYWVVGISSGYVLGFPMGLGAAGVWCGLVLGLTASVVALMWRFWRRALPAAEARFDGQSALMAAPTV
ncbi:MATE family efflux transporter [Tropicimonas isoalkanivorans]|uniref:Multidrug-efflux transporter n=1 Tax=Tropicimonas isoalkanivorans TaxID=441112 RepID=A0A1I1GKK2_9RHOB|nr:MATE family efflux transporter [Tropicimonas isoalkanivorans]SFC12289.1 multidrug resistance protein, MATE family [Tropicimonas isoalkanivorans]